MFGQKNLLLWVASLWGITRQERYKLNLLGVVFFYGLIV